MIERVLFRADGGAGIGSGHLMRCLGLAQQFARSDTTSLLATATPDAAPVDAWRGSGIAVHPLRDEMARSDESGATAILGLAERVDAQWIVLDGYAFEMPFQARLAQDRRVLLFDDLGGTVTAHILVNPNPGAENWAQYEAPPSCRMLLGSQYVVLRREIRAIRHSSRDESICILITFGGDDRENFALEVMRRLAQCAVPFRAIAICSSDAAGVAAAEEFAAAHSDRFRVVRPGPIEEYLAETDIAVCAGGTTSLECAALGIPTVTVVVADNQRKGATALAAAGAAFLAGEGWSGIEHVPTTVMNLLSNSGLRDRTAEIARRVVSRDGAERIVDVMSAAC